MEPIFTRHHLASIAAKQQQRTTGNQVELSSYPTWKNFFLSAGIPDSVANDYALKFSQHRIKMDMLKDITKEILLEMGIEAMGDIIAILRQAKNLSSSSELKGLVQTNKNNLSTPSVSASATNNNINKIIKTTMPHSTNNNLRPNKITTIDSASIKSRINPERLSLSNATTTTTTTTKSTSLNRLSGPITASKLQSRVSLDSGALMASSNNNNHILNHQGKRQNSNSNVSESLAKRLRPAASESSAIQRTSVASRLDQPEKTLTVYYPSSAAIAKVQQRLAGLKSSTSAGSSSNNGLRPSIASRLSAPTSSSSSSRHNHHSSQSQSSNNHHLHQDNRGRNPSLATRNPGSVKSRLGVRKAR